MKKLGKYLVAGLLSIVGLAVIVVVAGQVRVQMLEVPMATVVPNWQQLASAHEIPSIETVDADGDRRVTQIWIAAVEGVAYIRTGDTRWFANLRRRPALVLRIGGMAYDCTTQVVVDQDEVADVHAAFLAKYPRRSAFFRSVGIQTDTVLRLSC